MFLHDVFSPEFIKIGLEAEDKDEVFEELIDHYCETNKINVREDLLKSLWDRETKMSTGIQKGIAIPHGNTDAVENICGVLGLSRRGVDYDALDGEPVYLFFMIFAPHKDKEQHLRILKQLSEILHNPQFFIDLQSQKDTQGINKVIRKYEDLLITLD